MNNYEKLMSFLKIIDVILKIIGGRGRTILTETAWPWWTQWFFRAYGNLWH